jgi:hypothetical protein
MSTEEQEISLVVQSDHLTSLELRHGREEGTEESPGLDSQQGGEVVEDEFG